MPEPETTGLRVMPPRLPPWLSRAVAPLPLAPLQPALALMLARIGRAHPDLYDRLGEHAEKRFGLVYKSVPDHKQCECGAILRGVKQPTDCKLFGTVCTPENPMGSCMVSSEGACAAHYSYGRFRDIPVVAA